MARTIEHWRPSTGQYEAGAPGLEVLTADTAWGTTWPLGFRAAVDAALTWINATPTGAQVLTELETNGNDVGIAPSTYTNQVRMGTEDALNRVARELATGNRQPGSQTRNAATAAFGGSLGNFQAACIGLAAAINATPRWTLTATPGLGGWGTGLQQIRTSLNQWWYKLDSNEGYFEDQKWFRTLGLKGFDVGITGTQVRTWLTTGTLPTLSTEKSNHIILSTIAALEPNSPAGTGCTCAVQWYIDPNHVQNQLRPPAVGLGHELIHAYFGVRGEQPGVESPGQLTVELFEYKCVGLGPWDEVTPSENSLRKEWWPNTSGLIPTTDTLNRKVPPKRIMYG